MGDCERPQGGRIVKLEAELKEIVARETKLRAAIDEIVAELRGAK